MARYTYDQFRQSAQNAGLLNEFSQADLMEAQKDPDFGMTILKYKQDYHNATTDEGRARANYAANQYRSSRGGYTGGGDGGSFAQDWLSPRDFQYGSAPTYSNPYADDIADLWDQQKNFGDFTYEDAPVYNNRYDDEIQDLIQGILDRPDFSYDPETDLLYQQYRKQYNREGDRAVADALGAAAAASGGIPSSYANTAAAQAGNYYAAQLTDKIPELYELAYNQYLNDYQMQLSDLGVVQGAEQSDYDKYLNALNQYNTDRNFAYNQYLNNYDIANNNLQTALGLQDSSFNQYLAALDQFNTDRNFSYGQLLDEIDNQPYWPGSTGISPSSTTWASTRRTTPWTGSGSSIWTSSNTTGRRPTGTGRTSWKSGTTTGSSRPRPWRRPRWTTSWLPAERPPPIWSSRLGTARIILTH